MPPVPNFVPAGDIQASEWTDEITDLKDKVRFLETCARKQASDIAATKAELAAYKSVMHKDIVNVLYNNDDSVTKRLDSIDTQLLNDIPLAVSTETARIDAKINEMEAAIFAIVSEVSSQTATRVQHHDVATPVETAPNPTAQASSDPWHEAARARHPEQPQPARDVTRNLQTSQTRFQDGPTGPRPSIQYGPSIPEEEGIGSPFERGPPMQTPPPHARTERSPIFGPGGEQEAWRGPMPGGAGIPDGYQARSHWPPMRANTMDICRKKNDALKKFTGNLGDYQIWRERIVDHLCRGNRSWRKLLDSLQTCSMPITRSWLLEQSEAGYNGWELSEMLEGFLVDHLSDSLYRRRKQLSGGMLGNGFEMWRWLYNEFQGGSDAVNLGGARRLQDWPRCNKIENLSQHLDDWVECLETHCTDLLHAPGTLRSMILSIIPTDLEDELLSKPNVKSWQEIVSWCKVKTVYRRQKILAEQARKPGGRIASLLIEREGGEERSEAPAADNPAGGPPQWFQDYITKLGGNKGKGKGTKGAGRGNTKGTGKGIRISFEGCWHCGSKDHSRAKCPAFEKLMADHNRGVSDRSQWKLPAGYMGKYEEAKKKARAAAGKGKVNALDGPPEDGEYTEDDWEESDDEGPGPGRVFALRQPCTCCPSGLGDDLRDDDLLCGACQDDDEENEDETESQVPQNMLEEFGKWAHRTIVKAQNPSKKNLSKFVVNSIAKLEKMLRSKSKVASIANSSKDKAIEYIRKIIPGLPPCTADEVWALVDSGSTINAADILEHFPEYAKFIKRSKAQSRGEVATTAGGHELKHEGKCNIAATVDGFDFPIPFSNMKVDIPILSVRKAVKNGNDVTFTDDGGTIVNRDNGRTLTFIEANGSYWIKMKVLPPDLKDIPTNSQSMESSQVFTRPGA